MYVRVDSNQFCNPTKFLVMLFLNNFLPTLFPDFPNFDIEQNAPLFTALCLAVGSTLGFLAGVCTGDTLYKKCGLYASLLMFALCAVFATSEWAQTHFILTSLIALVVVLIGAWMIYMLTPANINNRRIAW